ncbi:alanine racemase C-terminal domain-containing protein [Streptomyces sp. CLV115]|uniref:alanine racemase C-terminal domain-containing protein n=1 Tax=Streptomyces sp. CLV115 TaxID=3138502 RepID=UPI00313E8F67
MRIAGTTYRAAGRVAMDHTVVYLGPDTDVAALGGHEAVLSGTGDDGGPTADDWARAAGTVNYEIVTRVSLRVPRVHVDSAPPPSSGPPPASPWPHARPRTPPT